MSWYREYLAVVFGPNRRNLATLVGVGALVVLAYFVLPQTHLSPGVRAGIRYGVWLVVFCIWMAWFVAAGVAVWRARTDSPAR